MFVSNPESFQFHVHGGSHVEGILFKLLFFHVCFLCLSVWSAIAPVADPNTVQIDRMITALKQLLLGLDSLSLSLAFMSLQPVHQCQYRPDGWGADSLRVSRFIFFLSVSIIPSYTPLKAVENHRLAWEETFDLTEADTISDLRTPIMQWVISVSGPHLCCDTFHNRLAKKVWKEHVQVIQPITT